LCCTGPSSPISLDSDDELDDFGYEAPLSNLILPCEDSTLQEEENNNNAEERKTKQVWLNKHVSKQTSLFKFHN
jgi:hypothetical protein